MSAIVSLILLGFCIPLISTVIFTYTFHIKLPFFLGFQRVHDDV